MKIGAAAPLTGAPALFDPQAYAAVYSHLLRHRNAATAMVNAPLTQNTSVYDLAVDATDIVPTDEETAEILMRLEREHTAEEIEHKVSRWFQSTDGRALRGLEQWPASYSGNLSSTGPLVS